VRLRILRGLPHAGLIRLVGFRAGQMASAIHYLATRDEAELNQAALVTATPERVRIRTC